MMLSRTTGQRLTQVIALCTTAAAMLTACSSSSGRGSATGDIHVAVLASYTGTYAAVGTEVYNGAAAGAAVVNAAGGINGRKLVLDKVDSKGDAADAAPFLQQEITLHHPAAIVGPTTLEIFGVQPVIERNKIPDMFNGGSTAFDKNKSPWIWRINPSDSQLALALALYAHNKGITNAAIVFTTEESQQELEPFLKDDFTKLGGTITSTTNITPGQSSYNSEINKIIAGNPQAILGQMEPATAATFFSQLNGQKGTSLPFIGTDLTAGSDWIGAVGPKYANAAVTSIVGGTPVNAAGDAFNQQYQKLFNSAPLAGSNYSYDGVVALALAMDATKSTANTDITKGLPQVSNPPGSKCFTYATCLASLKAGQKIDYDGASGPLDFNKYHNVSGPWDVVKADPSGKLTTLTTITADEVTAAAAKVGG